MKFLCDHMLIWLAKWLRAAGYDTTFATASMSDQEILSEALEEKRLLITRDRHFLSNKHAKNVVIYLKSNQPIDCIKELNSLVQINWLYQPFSRCLKCNQLLTTLSSDCLAVIQQVPESVKNKLNPYRFCSHCYKVYWEGSHARRMKEQLLTWQTLL